MDHARALVAGRLWRGIETPSAETVIDHATTTPAGRLWRGVSGARARRPALAKLRRVTAAAETLKRAPELDAQGERDRVFRPAHDRAGALSGRRYLGRVTIDSAEAMQRGSR